MPIWQRLPARLVLLAVPAGLTASVLAFNLTLATKLVVLLTLAVSLASPAEGLLLVAFLAPLGQLIAPVVGSHDFRMGEAIVLAFLVGWLVRARGDRRGPRVAAPAAGALLAATVIGSIAGLAWKVGRFPGALPETLDQIVHLYFFAVDRIGLSDGARLLEGLGLAVTTVALVRRRPSLSVTLPGALAASAAVAAGSSLLLWRGIASPAALERFAKIGYRVSGHVPDVNAAGSYFAMIACLALGMALRARGAGRALWLGLAAASGVGLWFSESRSALGAAGAIVIIAAAWLTTGRWSVRTRTAALCAMAIVLLAAGVARTRLLQRDLDYHSAEFRGEFNAASVRMIADRPVFGVGMGQYYPMSSRYLSPRLAWSYGSENAHNYFLQVGGELGLVGLALFVVWIGAPLARSAAAIARVPDDGRLIGAAAGTLAFLVTCLTGHPLLIGEVAYPFWLQFGLVTALAGSALLDGRPPSGPQPRSWLATAAAMAMAILVLAPALTARDAVSPPDTQAVDGFYGWETLEDGTRFRWTDEYASLFVPADVTRVYIPVRLPTSIPAVSPMGITIVTAGVKQGRTLIEGGAWALIEVRLPDAAPPTRFKRIDLKVDRRWQPAIYIAGSADLRFVGVQVGEPKLLRE